jgi:hypothetical protein
MVAAFDASVGRVPDRLDHCLEPCYLKDDPGERSNLAAREPAPAQSLHAWLRAWRTEVRAQLPVPNPDYPL